MGSGDALNKVCVIPFGFRLGAVKESTWVGNFEEIVMLISCLYLWYNIIFHKRRLKIKNKV